MSEKRRQSIYLPDDMLNDLRAEANRTDRSLSWLIQHAWKMARPEIGNLPTMTRREEAPEAPAAAAGVGF